MEAVGDIFTRYVSLLFCTCIQPISSCVDAGNEGVGWRLKKFGGVYVWDFNFLGGGKAAHHWYSRKKFTYALFPASRFLKPR